MLILRLQSVHSLPQIFYLPFRRRYTRPSNLTNTNFFVFPTVILLSKLVELDNLQIFFRFGPNELVHALPDIAHFFFQKIDCLFPLGTGALAQGLPMPQILNVQKIEMSVYKIFSHVRDYSIIILIGQSC